MSKCVGIGTDSRRELGTGELGREGQRWRGSGHSAATRWGNQAKSDFIAQDESECRSKRCGRFDFAGRKQAETGSADKPRSACSSLGPRSRITSLSRYRGVYVIFAVYGYLYEGNKAKRRARDFRASTVDRRREPNRATEHGRACSVVGKVTQAFISRSRAGPVWRRLARTSIR